MEREDRAALLSEGIERRRRLRQPGREATQPKGVKTMEFTIHTLQSVPEGSRPSLEELEARVGFIPNLAATIADSPTAMQGFSELQGALRQSQLSTVEREVVGLTVSWENSSAYSMAAHSAFAQGARAGEEVVSALRSGGDIPDDRLHALQEFTRTLVRDRGHVGEESIAALLEAGYSKEQILELITQVAYTTFANLVANVADTPVDEAFEPQAWTVAAV
jgi:uncharacterized peroxidase-related enzyme